MDSGIKKRLVGYWTDAMEEWKPNDHAFGQVFGWREVFLDNEEKPTVLVENPNIVGMPGNF